MCIRDSYLNREEKEGDIQHHRREPQRQARQFFYNDSDAGDSAGYQVHRLKQGVNGKRHDKRPHQYADIIRSSIFLQLLVH